MSVKRYDVSGFGDGMVESEDGAFYYIDDYHALQDLNAELLEALEAAQMAIMGYTHQNSVTMAALFKAESAIAKARGQS